MSPRVPRQGLLLAALTLSVACGREGDDELGASSMGTSRSAASTGTNNQGTKLSVSTSPPTLVCSADGSGGTVTLGFTVTSTAAADAAELTAIVDGGAEIVIGQIASGPAGWTFNGPTKTAQGTATFTLANGDHTIVICATQHGAHGRLSKRACSDAVAITVACQLDKKPKCNQGVGNGAEGCDPGNSGKKGSNDENGGTPGNPGKRGGG